MSRQHVIRIMSLMILSLFLCAAVLAESGDTNLSVGRLYEPPVEITGPDVVYCLAPPSVFSAVLPADVNPEDVWWEFDLGAAPKDPFNIFYGGYEGDTTTITFDVRLECEFDLLLYENDDLLATKHVSAQYYPTTLILECGDITENEEVLTYTVRIPDVVIPQQELVVVRLFGTAAVNDFDYERLTGTLTPYENGTVTLVVSSSYDRKTVVSKTVNISGQLPKTVRYHSGTDDPVEGLPPDETVWHTYTVSDTVPTREGYIFLGYTFGEDSFMPVEQIDLTADADLYALWGKPGRRWTTGLNGDIRLSKNSVIEFEEKDGYVEYSMRYQDGLRIVLDVDPLDPKRYRGMLVKISTDAGETARTQMYYKARYRNEDGSEALNGYNAGPTPYQNAEVLSVYASSTGAGMNEPYFVYLPVYEQSRTKAENIAGSWYRDSTQAITTLYLDPFKKAGTAIRLYEFDILDGLRQITFDPNGGNVTDLPAPADVYQGESVRLDAFGAPKREGFTFLGWSRTKTGEAVETMPIREDVTVYAVWKNERYTETTVTQSDGGTVVLHTEAHGLPDDARVLAAAYDGTGRLLAIAEMRRDAMTAEMPTASRYSVYAFDGNLSPLTADETLSGES